MNKQELEPYVNYWLEEISIEGETVGGYFEGMFRKTVYDSLQAEMQARYPHATAKQIKSYTWNAYKRTEELTLRKLKQGNIENPKEYRKNNAVAKQV